MVIFKGNRRFELMVQEHDGEWAAMLREFIPGRLYPTQHLCRKFDARQAAIDALLRKWRRLFPDDDVLVWRDPPGLVPARPSRRPRNRN